MTMARNKEATSTSEIMRAFERDFWDGSHGREDIKPDPGAALKAVHESAANAINYIKALEKEANEGVTNHGVQANVGGAISNLRDVVFNMGILFYEQEPDIAKFSSSHGLSARIVARYKEACKCSLEQNPQKQQDQLQQQAEVSRPAPVAVSPPGWDKTVEHMKDHPEIDNPWALAWYMKNKGDTPHYASDPKVFLAAHREMSQRK
jgi:hypothetical protein